MSYIVIPKSISKYSQGKNKNTDIYVYSYIKLNSNFKTGISQITEETISLKLDIPLRTVERIISRLKADNNKIIKIETLQKEKTKRRNLYSFEKKPENYFILDTSFFFTDLSVKVKGFLLFLKSISTNNTNIIPFSINKISGMLSQDVKSVSALIKECIDLKQLKKIDTGYLITNDSFLLSVKETPENRTFDIISDFCNSKNITPPKRNNGILTIISTKFDVMGEFINDENENRDLKKELNKRCNQLPEKISMEYFLKALCNIEVPEKVIVPDSIIV